MGCLICVSSQDARFRARSASETVASEEGQEHWHDMNLRLCLSLRRHPEVRLGLREEVGQVIH